MMNTNKVKTFDLDLEGFYPEFMIKDIPDKSGIYFVFGATRENKKLSCIKRLIYIGESKDVQERLEHHEKKPKFEDSLEDGECLYYACVFLPKTERELCEKGLIKHFSASFGKGLINKLSTKSFNTFYTCLKYNLKGKVPRFFVETDRVFEVEPRDYRSGNK